MNTLLEDNITKLNYKKIPKSLFKKDKKNIYTYYEIWIPNQNKPVYTGTTSYLKNRTQQHKSNYNNSQEKHYRFLRDNTASWNDVLIIPVFKFKAGSSKEKYNIERQLNFPLFSGERKKIKGDFLKFLQTNVEFVFKARELPEAQNEIVSPFINMVRSSTYIFNPFKPGLLREIPLLPLASFEGPLFEGSVKVHSTKKCTNTLIEYYREEGRLL